MNTVTDHMHTVTDHMHNVTDHMNTVTDHICDHINTATTWTMWALRVLLEHIFNFQSFFFNQVRAKSETSRKCKENETLWDCEGYRPKMDSLHVLTETKYATGNTTVCDWIFKYVDDITAQTVPKELYIFRLCSNCDILKKCSFLYLHYWIMEFVFWNCSSLNGYYYVL